MNSINLKKMLQSDSAESVSTLRKVQTLVGLHILGGVCLTAFIISMCGTGIMNLTTYINAEGNQVVNGYFYLVVFIYFLLALGGNHFASTANNYSTCLFGYFMMILGVSLLLATVMPMYTIVDIMDVVMTTGVIALVMTIIAFVMPRAFLGLGRSLFVGLTAFLIAEITALIFGFHSTNLFATVAILLFSLYIGYDWQRGLALACENGFNVACVAVFTAAQIYMDVINIFVRILSLKDTKK